MRWRCAWWLLWVVNDLFVVEVLQIILNDILCGVECANVWIYFCFHVNMCTCYLQINSLKTMQRRTQNCQHRVIAMREWAPTQSHQQSLTRMRRRRQTHNRQNYGDSYQLWLNRSGAKGSWSRIIFANNKQLIARMSARMFLGLCSPAIGHPMSRSINSSTNHSINRSINKPIHQSINPYIINRSINEPTINQPMNKSTKQSINQSTNRSIN